MKKDEQGKVVSFFSFSGGVGKTTLVVNIAKMLAEQGKKTIVLELELLSPKYQTIFGFNPAKSIDELYMQNFRNNLELETVDTIIKKSIITNDYGVDFIIPTAPATIEDLINRDRDYHHKDFANFIRNLLVYLRKKYEIVLIDSPSITNTEIMSVLLLSDKLVYVCIPPFEDLTEEIEQIKKFPESTFIDPIDVIINKVPVETEKERQILERKMKEQLKKEQINKVRVVELSLDYIKENVKERRIYIEKEKEKNMYQTLLNYSKEL